MRYSFIMTFTCLMCLNVFSFAQTNHHDPMYPGKAPRDTINKDNVYISPKRDSIPQAKTESSLIVIKDSLYGQIRDMQRDINAMKMNLYRCHKQYKIGTGVIIGGVATTVLGAILVGFLGKTSVQHTGYYYSYYSNPIPYTYTTTEVSVAGYAGTVMLVIGPILSTVVGPIIHADSHRFIGRAGKDFRQYKKLKSMNQ